MSQLTYWRDRPITELSRDELLDVIQVLAAHYQETMSPTAIHERALGQVERFKRGEAA